MTWIIPALLAGIIRAFAFDVNRHHQVEGATLNFWRLLMVVPIMLIITLFLEYPNNPYFYGVALFCGLVIGVGDQYLWKLAGSKNAKIASMFDAINSFGTFFLWLAVSPVFFFSLIETPLTLVGILGCYALLFAGVWILKRCKYSWEAFRLLLIICFFNIIDQVLIKAVMQEVSVSFENVFIFTTLAYFIALCISAYIYKVVKKNTFQIQKEVIKPAVSLGCLFAIGAVLSFYALSAAPNPGYATALAALAPAWLVIIHKIQKAEDNAKVLPVLMILASSIILILLTR